MSQMAPSRMLLETKSTSKRTVQKIIWAFDSDNSPDVAPGLQFNHLGDETQALDQNAFEDGHSVLVRGRAVDRCVAGSGKASPLKG
jgi:hypothetical protein